MRTILLTALCAVAIGIQAKVANDTIDKYIIDKQPVEHFDGSQLEGKCISKYMIAYKQGKGVVERHHVIYTGDEAEKTIRVIGSGNGPIVSIAKEPLIFVNGTETSPADFAKIKPEEIAHIEVIKDTDLAAKQWGSKGVNGVIIVTTKAIKSGDTDVKGVTVSKFVEPLIIVDGEEVSQKELEKINPSDIDHIDVLRNGSKAAEQWGSKGLNGVIIVTTKGGKEK